ncbi:MAG: hypothetical protein GY862_28605 [Gammaproteobacteria bacterium]|nr:hypothetical protein [Gammaproteobacteria bacterium]
MKSDAVLSEEQLIHQAIEVLIEKMGLLETTRFFALKSQGGIDSVERHRQWQADLDKDAFFDQVFDK